MPGTMAEPRYYVKCIIAKTMDLASLWSYRSANRRLGLLVAVIAPLAKDSSTKSASKAKTFVTDDWDGYHRLIPEDQLFTGKDLTVFIEQDNSNIRHFVARFRRRTKVVSKSEEMVDLSLRLYHHLHDNLESLIAKISIFRSIFN